MTLVLLTNRILSIIEGAGGHAEPELLLDALAAHTARPYARSAIAMAVKAKTIKQGPLGLLEAVPATTRSTT